MTLRTWTKQKYGITDERLLVAVMGCEAFNPNLPASVKRPQVRDLSRNRMAADMAALRIAIKEKQ